MGTKTGRKRQQAAPVTWRDGIHITGTSIWCDAVRARDVCFLSAASAMRGAKHAQLIASQDSLRLLGESKGSSASRLAVPFGQPFSLGAHRIELFASGHALGSASLLVKVGNQKVVYAGIVNPRGSALGGALDHRSADILVVSGRYGGNGISFPDQDAEFAKLGTRCETVASAGGIAVLLVRDSGKALDLAVALAGLGIPVQAHRRFFDAAQRTRPGVFGRFRRWNPRAQYGRILLWPMQTRSGLEEGSLTSESEIFLVSGRALSAASVDALGASEGFVLSNQADREELIRYIESSGAKQVYLTHSPDRGRGIADALPKVRVEAIGPPEQLSLFGS